MSKSVYVKYREHGFWAFDVVVSVFLKHLVDSAVPEIPTHGAWLGELVERWRVQTAFPDCYGVQLDYQWPSTRLEVVTGLLKTTCQRLGERDEIPATEIEQWELIQGNKIYVRGLAFVRTKPLIQFGQAMMLLIWGMLPPAPAGTWDGAINNCRIYWGMAT